LLRLLSLHLNLAEWNLPSPDAKFSCWLSPRSTVTRLGEFSAIGRLFTLGKCYRSSPTFWILFPRLQLCIINFKKWVGLHFGRLFHKLLWSPCLEVKFRHYAKTKHASNLIVHNSDWPNRLQCSNYVGGGKCVLSTLFSKTDLGSCLAKSYKYWFRNIFNLHHLHTCNVLPIFSGGKVFSLILGKFCSRMLVKWAKHGLTINFKIWKYQILTFF
jgi:hypothetical protein